jgi:hypothetical protein
MEGAMRTWWLVAAVTAIGVVAGPSVWRELRPVAAGVRLQNCEDWVFATSDRVDAARSYLYPSDRPGAFAGSAREAAEELYVLFEEQADSAPPENGQQLNDDLVEALSEGASGLAGGGTVGAIQVTFAKSIVYNADARLVTLLNSC